MEKGSGLFRIEEAGYSDLPEMTMLLGVLFSIESDFTPSSSRQKKGLSMLLENRERARVFVAKSPDGRVVGMVSAQLVVSTAEGGYSSWIEDVVVHPDCRDLGIGKALLEGATDWSWRMGATRCQLMADHDNSPAQAFYDFLGWRATRLGVRRLVRER